MKADGVEGFGKGGPAGLEDIVELNVLTKKAHERGEIFDSGKGRRKRSRWWTTDETRMGVPLL